MTTNIERAMEELVNAGVLGPVRARQSAQALADAGLLAPEPPREATSVITSEPVDELIATAHSNYLAYGWSDDPALSQAVIVGEHLRIALDDALAPRAVPQAISVTREQVEALLSKWRKDIAGNGDYYTGLENAYRNAADDLETALLNGGSDE